MRVEPPIRFTAYDDLDALLAHQARQIPVSIVLVGLAALFISTFFLVGGSLATILSDWRSLAISFLSLLTIVGLFIMYFRWVKTELGKKIRLALPDLFQPRVISLQDDIIRVENGIECSQYRLGDVRTTFETKHGFSFTTVHDVNVTIAKTKVDDQAALAAFISRMKEASGKGLSRKYDEKDVPAAPEPECWQAGGSDDPKKVFSFVARRTKDDFVKVNRHRFKIRAVPWIIASSALLGLLIFVFINDGTLKVNSDWPIDACCGFFTGLSISLIIILPILIAYIPMLMRAIPYDGDEIGYVFSPSGIRMSHKMFKTCLKWGYITKVVFMKDYLVLSLTRFQSIVIPYREIDGPTRVGLRELVLEKAVPGSCKVVYNY